VAQKEKHDSKEETIFNKKRFNPSIFEISYSFSDLKSSYVDKKGWKGGFPLVRIYFDPGQWYISPNISSK